MITMSRLYRYVKSICIYSCVFKPLFELCSDSLFDEIKRIHVSSVSYGLQKEILFRALIKVNKSPTCGPFIQ